MRIGLPIALFIPHCHGNRLAIGGVYLRCTRDYLMGSWITVGFTPSWIYAQKVNWLPDCHGQWGIKQL